MTGAVSSLDCAGRHLDLSRPAVMGVLNVTPDSFSDGGEWLQADTALGHARAMVDAGAAIIDVGGESTRPGAEPVALEEELARVVPVIQRVAAAVPVPISIDTSKPEVMRAAVAAGAGLVNDVNALRAPGALETVAELAVPVCLMHMRGEPRTMQTNPEYGDVVSEVHAYLAERIAACEAAGIPRHRVLVDPGFGFGKTVRHNLELLAALERFTALGCALLVGLSRKSMLGRITGAGVEDRLGASVAAAVLAAERGAALVRAHDVGATVQALAVVESLRGTG